MTLLGLEESSKASEAEGPDFLCELPPLSIPQSPLQEWSFEAEEEELKDRPDNAFYRLLRKVTADMRAECQREAEALGFPSWEAKERHDREESRKWLEEYVKEHGHLPQPPTVTEEQRAIFERRQERQREAERELLEPRCHCLGWRHPPHHSIAG